MQFVTVILKYLYSEQMLEPVNFSYVYLPTLRCMLLPKSCAKKMTSFTSLYTFPMNSLFPLPHLLRNPLHLKGAEFSQITRHLSVHLLTPNFLPPLAWGNPLQDPT